MGYEKRYEHLPYGPLTRSDFVMLAGSYYNGDGPRGSLLAVVKQRGITRDDFVRLHLAEAGIDGNKTNLETSKPDLGGSGAGQAGVELPE